MLEQTTPTPLEPPIEAVGREAAYDWQGHNEELLVRSEIGIFLLDAYHSAISIDPRMSDIAIVPIEDPDDPRHGYALSKESKGNETGVHEVHIRLDDLDAILAKYEEAMKGAPEAIRIIAGQLGIPAEEITPQALYVQSILHEMGHLTENMDAEEAGEPSLPNERRKKEMAAMPLGQLAISKLSKPDSAESIWFEKEWQNQAKRHGVETREELIDMQSTAYRNMTSEKIADGFAADVFATNPLLLSHMQHGDLDHYREPVPA